VRDCHGLRRDTPSHGVTSWIPTGSDQKKPAELTIKVRLAVAAGDADVTEILQRQRRASIEQLEEHTRRNAQADPDRDVAFLILLDALIFRTKAEIRWSSRAVFSARMARSR
jgi:hypothetical protein